MVSAPSNKQCVSIRCCDNFFDSILPCLGQSVQNLGRVKCIKFNQNLAGCGPIFFKRNVAGNEFLILSHVMWMIGPVSIPSFRSLVAATLCQQIFGNAFARNKFMASCTLGFTRSSINEHFNYFPYESHQLFIHTGPGFELTITSFGGEGVEVRSCKLYFQKGSRVESRRARMPVAAALGAGNKK